MALRCDLHKLTVLASSKVRGVAESLVMTKDDLEFEGTKREVKQFKNVGLKTKSSLGLDCY